MAYDTSCVTTHMSWFYEQISFINGPLDLFQGAVAADLNTKVKWK